MAKVETIIDTPEGKMWLDYEEFLAHREFQKLQERELEHHFRYGHLKEKQQDEQRNNSANKGATSSGV